MVPARVRERGSDFAGKVRFTRNEFSPTNNGHPAPLLKTSGQIAMKILVLLAFCASATIAFSADPFHGSRKKSNGLSGGQIWRNSESPAVLKIEVQGDVATIQGVITEEPEVFKLDGTPTPRKSGGSLGEERSLKRVHPSVWRFYHDLHGVEQTDRSSPTPFVQEGHFPVSSNGEFLTMAILRTYADGTSKYYFRVFEKQ